MNKVKSLIYIQEVFAGRTATFKAKVFTLGTEVKVCMPESKIKTKYEKIKVRKSNF